MQVDEQMMQLQAPFDLGEIKWRLRGDPVGSTDMAPLVAYVSVEAVAQRLDEVLGVLGGWSHEFFIPPLTAPEKGVTYLGCRMRVGGRVLEALAEDSGIMAAEARAFKRVAALYLGVGRFLYRFPAVYGRVEAHGKNWRISPVTETELIELTRLLIENPRQAFPHFQHLWVFRDTLIASGAGEEEQQGGVGLSGRASPPSEQPAKKAPAPGAIRRSDDEATPATTDATAFWVWTYAHQVPRAEAQAILQGMGTPIDWAEALRQLSAKFDTPQ